MKIIGFEYQGRLLIGRLQGEGQVVPLGEMAEFWRNPGSAAEGGPLSLSAVRIRPAVPPTARVICIGLNYRKHAEETGSAIPPLPVVFGRWPNTLCVDGDPVPALEDRFDWEAELGVVVGRRMFDVDEAAAQAGVFGYAAFNDLSARSFQFETAQWTLGKNSDASGPMSPVVTVDEVGDPAKGLRITTRVNGKVVQDSTTADMIFTVPRLIAHLSRAMTLEPGDFIVTGTPQGVGLATETFLKAGDVVEVEVEGVGKVRSPIAARPARLA